MSQTSDLRTVQDLFDYNTWANAQVFAICQSADQAQLDAQAPGTLGSITQTLAHLVGVEAFYVLILRGQMDALKQVREALGSESLSDWAARAVQLGAEYRELLSTADAAFLDSPLTIPWFDFALTNRDGLLQVVHHSAQHRAQVFSVLGDRGVKVPDLDYVLFVKSKTRPSATASASEQQ